MWRWPFPRTTSSRRNGSVTLITLCLFFVFSSVGLGVLYLSQIHLKLQSFRKNTLQLDTAAENGIKLGAAQLAAQISQKSGIEIISTTEFTELSQSIQQEKIDLLERALGIAFPGRASGNAGEQEWNVDTSAVMSHHSDYDDFIQARFQILSQAQATLQHFPETKQESLKSSLTIAAGRIPLSLIPILIDQEAEPGNSHLKENHIEVLDIPSASASTGPVFSGGGLIPDEIPSQVREALKLDIFYPEDLSRSQLRRALGLEIIDEPIPAGVYLIEDDMGLGGVYIEGDCDRLGLAVAGDSQVFDFQIGQEEWRLTFNPVQETTEFVSPQDTRFFELTPLGIIIVNGAVHSLEAGVIDADGGFLRTIEEIPCILGEVSLSIIASEQITLTTHLLRQGVSWQDEIPIIKDTDSQLHIFAAGSDILGNPTGEGKVIIDTTETPSLKIEASVTAAETEIQSAADGGEALLIGSLHTGRHLAHGNTLKLIYDRPPEDSASPFAPRTAQPVLFLNDFHIMEWSEDL